MRGGKEAKETNRSVTVGDLHQFKLTIQVTHINNSSMESIKEKETVSDIVRLNPVTVTKSVYIKP